MHRLLPVVLLLAVQVAALDFREFVPLTNTRYVPALVDKGVMVTDGIEPFLFDGTRNTIRMTRVKGGVPQTAQVVLDRTSHDPDPAAVWTGTHFLVAATALEGGIVGALIERNGTIVRPRFKITGGSRPVLAASSQSVLLVFATQTSVKALSLDRNGNAGSERYLPAYRDYFAASNGDGFLVATRYMVHVFGRNGEYQSTVAQDLGGPIALASDGRDYVLLTSGYGSGTRAVRVLADGTPENQFTVERFENWGAALAWAESGYALVYRFYPGTDTYVAYLDRNGSPLGERAVAPLPARARYASVVVNGRLFAAAFSHQSKPIVRELRADGESYETGYAAADQDLLSVTSSDRGTLFLWRESGAVHAGFRSHDGEWSEELLSVSIHDAMVASDGTEFLVVSANGGSWRALRLSETGRPAGESVAILPAGDRWITDIVWDGRRFLAAGFDYASRGVFVMPIDSSAPPQGPKIVRSGLSSSTAAMLASDGNGVLVVWNEPSLRQQSFFAARRDHELNGDGAIQIADAPAGAADLAWTGTEYAFVWSEGLTIHCARIPSDAKRVASRVAITPPTDLPPSGRGNLSVAGIDGRAVIGWIDYDGHGRDTSRLALAGDSGIELFTLAASKLSRPWVVPVANGLARVIARPEVWAPHHGGTRLMLAFADEEQTPSPAAPPRLDAIPTREGVVHLEWTAPAGPVNGFRIESQVEGGPWKEVERWFTPKNRFLAVHLRDPEARTRFRMRAINDGGISDYSEDAVVNAPRRRAVR